MGMRKRLTSGLCLGLAMAAAAPAVAGAQAGSDVWDPVSGALPATRGGSPADIQPDRFRAFTLDQSELEAGLAAAPKAGLNARGAVGSVVLTLPAPDGGFQRFEVYESPIMEPGLAAKHPDIKTYAGRGVDDPAATVRADTSPLGFHASVRSPNGTGTSTRTTTSTTASTSATSRATSARTRTACSSRRTPRATAIRSTSSPRPPRPGLRSCCGPTGSR